MKVIKKEPWHVFSIILYENLLSLVNALLLLREVKVFFVIKTVMNDVIIRSKRRYLRHCNKTHTRKYYEIDPGLVA